MPSTESDALRMRLDAVQAAVEVARRLGLSFDEARVLRDGSNVLVHLAPTMTVARVATATAEFRPGGAWLARELAILDHLAAKGAPAIRPSVEVAPGPHEHAGLWLAFHALEMVDEHEPAEPRAAGRALRSCHEALADCDVELQPWAVLPEARRVLARVAAEGGLAPSDAKALERRALGLERDLAGSKLRPLHGDAHLSNALATPGGVLWGDWEDAFLGPVAWDIACLVSSARVLGVDVGRVDSALSAYGTSVDPEELDLCVEARTLYAAVWGLYLASTRGVASARAEARLRWLFARARRGA